MFAIVLLLIEILFFLVLINVFPDFLGISKDKDDSMVPYANIPEIRNYIIDFFVNDNRNPLNLQMTEIKQEGIMSVGKENQKTEIYIVKFKDTSPLSRDIYYCAARVEEPNKLRYTTRNIQITIEEEEQIFNRLANQLAKAPEKERVTEIRREKTELGEDIVKTIREPEEFNNKNVEEEM